MSPWKAIHGFKIPSDWSLAFVIARTSTLTAN